MSYLVLFVITADKCNLEVKEEASGLMVECKFPFIFSGTEYNSCTTEHEAGNNLWCSTKIDPISKEHVNGQGWWGYCQEISCNSKGNFMFGYYTSSFLNCLSFLMSSLPDKKT